MKLQAQVEGESRGLKLGAGREIQPVVDPLAGHNEEIISLGLSCSTPEEFGREGDVGHDTSKFCSNFQNKIW